MCIVIDYSRGTETEEEINLRLHNALIEVSQADEKGLFDAIIVNDDIEKATHLFFRLVRDWYPALPSAARIRMLQRRIKHIKALSIANNNNNGSNSNDSNHNNNHLLINPSHDSNIVQHGVTVNSSHQPADIHDNTVEHTISDS